MTNVLDLAEQWFDENQANLIAAGFELRFSRTDDDRPKHACVISIREGRQESELILWDSGEAELGLVRVSGKVREEHLDDINSEEALNGVLGRMLRNFVS